MCDPLEIQTQKKILRNAVSTSSSFCDILQQNTEMVSWL